MPDVHAPSLTCKNTPNTQKSLPNYILLCKVHWSMQTQPYSENRKYPCTGNTYSAKAGDLGDLKKHENREK